MKLTRVFGVLAGFGVLIACTGGPGAFPAEVTGPVGGNDAVGNGLAGSQAPCRQKADSDTNKACQGFPSKPRKLDCDSDSQTEAAVAAGCTQPQADDHDVCCPTTITGTPQQSSVPPTPAQPAPPAATCANNVGGTWKLTGTCPETSCNVTQNNCAINIACTQGTTLSGTISGSIASVTGSSNGQALTCTVGFNGTTSFALSCGSVCNGTGTK